MSANLDYISKQLKVGFTLVLHGLAYTYTDTHVHAHTFPTGKINKIK